MIALDEDSVFVYDYIYFISEGRFNLMPLCEIINGEYIPAESKNDKVVILNTNSGEKNTFEIPAWKEALIKSLQIKEITDFAIQPKGFPETDLVVAFKKKYIRK